MHELHRTCRGRAAEHLPSCSRGPHETNKGVLHSTKMIFFCSQSRSAASRDFSCSVHLLLETMSFVFMTQTL